MGLRLRSQWLGSRKESRTRRRAVRPHCNRQPPRRREWLGEERWTRDSALKSQDCIENGHRIQGKPVFRVFCLGVLFIVVWYVVVCSTSCFVYIAVDETSRKDTFLLDQLLSQRLLKGLSQNKHHYSRFCLLVYWTRGCRATSFISQPHKEESHTQNALHTPTLFPVLRAM